MPSDSDGSPSRPPRLLLAIIALAVVLGGWYASRLYTTGSARACAERYSAARNAADSVSVDSLVPDSSHALTTCGMIRTNARWT